MSGETFRAAVERAMRDDGASDADIAAALARIGHSVAVYGRVRVRGRPGRQNVKQDGGAVPLTPAGIAQLARLLPGGANRGGRTDERAGRLAEYRAAIAALADAGYSPGQTTARLVLERIHRTGSESQLREDVAAVGGWKAFRAEALRGR